MKKPLRVLQVIDSLEPGGSEKMAVQLANCLSEKIELSALVCTRQSGALAQEINSKVVVKKLNKKGTLDIGAFLKLRSFVKKNRITIIHAHSSSFFWSVLIKLFTSKVKLIWHDHYGFRTKTSNNKTFVLQLFSIKFDGIITVNKALQNWSAKNLKCKSVHYLPNFSLNNKDTAKGFTRKLKGDPDSIKIVHVANLRTEKDHLTALKAITILKKQNTNISYHALGQYDKKSEYYISIKNYIEEHNLQEIVYFYGCQSGIIQYLMQSDIGVLSSLYEGLPVSLLEYIHAELPVVVTDAGHCKAIVQDYGHVVKPKKEVELAAAINRIIISKEEWKQKAKALKRIISKNMNADNTISQLIDIYSLTLI